MAILHLEVKFIKIQNSPLYNCPKPQNNEDCQGLFIHTRKFQKECVACMQLHHTIDEYPLLKKIAPKKIIYKVRTIKPLYVNNFDILTVWLNDNQPTI